MPNTPMKLSYADSDDFGGFAGEMTFVNGETVKTNIPTSNDEVLMLAAEILGVDLENEYVTIDGSLTCIWEDNIVFTPEIMSEAKRVLDESSYESLSDGLCEYEDEHIKGYSIDLPAYWLNLIIRRGGIIEEEIKRVLKIINKD